MRCILVTLSQWLFENLLKYIFMFNWGPEIHSLCFSDLYFQDSLGFTQIKGNP